MSKNYGSKLFNGTVSIIKNTKDKLVLESDPAGNWSNDNVDDLYDKLVALAKEHKATINLFEPDSDATETVLSIRAGRGGHPYLALLPKDGSGGRKQRVKLA